MIDREAYRRELALDDDNALTLRAVRLLRMEAFHGSQRAGVTHHLEEVQDALTKRGQSSEWARAVAHVERERKGGRGNVIKFAEK